MEWPKGVGLRVLDSVDSTNAEARRLALSGEPGPLWISARQQSAGRGRRGRAWRSPEGALAATCLFRPQGSALEAARHSFAAALALAELFENAAPRAHVTLKWPNDALIDGRKAAGVLLESAGTGGSVDWLAVGVGVNLRAAPEPEEGGWPPIALSEVSHAAPDADEALTRLAARFAAWSDRLAAEGFAPLRSAWLARAARLGQKIVARLPNETVEGVFTDLDADGALVMDANGVERRISAADVFFP